MVDTPTLDLRPATIAGWQRVTHPAIAPVAEVSGIPGLDQPAAQGCAAVRTHAAAPNSGKPAVAKVALLPLIVIVHLVCAAE